MANAESDTSYIKEIRPKTDSRAQREILGGVGAIPIVRPDAVRRRNVLPRSWEFISPEQEYAAKDTFEAWKMIKRMSVDAPVQRDAIVRRLAAARTDGTKITGIVPWETSEKRTWSLYDSGALNRLFSISSQLRDNGIQANFLIIPEDSDIFTDNDNTSIVESTRYFTELEENAHDRFLMCMPSTELQTEMKDWDVIPDNKNLEPMHVKERRIAEAEAWRRRSFASTVDATLSVDRLIDQRRREAVFLESKYPNVIKFSLTRPDVDHALLRGAFPTLYIFPEEEREPWRRY